MILTYLPNLDELSFLTVLALPNASKIGLQAIIFSSILWVGSTTLPDNYVKKFIAILAFSVLPAPLSPLITMA